MPIKKIAFLVIVVMSAFDMVGLVTAGDIDTPLPGDVNVLTPDPSIGKIAECSGIWKGAYESGRAVTIVLEKIDPLQVIAIYSYGSLGGDKPGWRRVTGHIKDESAIVLEWMNVKLTLTLVNATIKAEWNKGENILKATLHKQNSP
jgi:hypothetical protein